MARLIDKKEKRNDIARAAMKVFCEKGISSTTIYDIAKSEEVAKGTIYLYFKNKEEIIFAIWDMMFELHLEKTTRLIKPTMSAKEKILLCFYFESFKENADDIMRLYHYFVSAMLTDTTGLYTSYFEQFIQQDYNIITTYLQEGINSGEFQKMDIYLLTWSIIFTIRGIMIKSKISNLTFEETQQFLTRQISFLLDNFTRKVL